ncbi:MAG: transposase [Candidatus Cloacimonetes bacterium]|jgi:transposase InsO family protein|nr:transposase [Candidatus Cloacimonadota bacterium]
MPWIRKSAMSLKHDFIKDYLTDNFTVAELARAYSISRKTAYKYIKRYKQYGYDGLKELSRAPKSSSKRISDEIIEEIVNLKLRYPSWGPKKIIARLKLDNPDKKYPTASTAQRYLESFGLVKKRKRRKRVPPYTEPFATSTKSNISWSVDYKGQFKMANGQYCYPLTLLDNYSRKMLLGVALPSTNYEDARKWLEWAFREYGLPDTIRSDNGTPFAARGLTGLTKLSAWFIQLGIKHERIAKGRPEQNGRLERLHRTLKNELIHSSPQDMRDAQRIINEFISQYNNERPHEALDFKVPEMVHTKSIKKYPTKIPTPKYPKGMLVRKVHKQGVFYYDWKDYKLSSALVGEFIGIKVIDGHTLEIFYYDKPIAKMSINDGKLYRTVRKINYHKSLSNKMRHQK